MVLASTCDGRRHVRPFRLYHVPVSAIHNGPWVDGWRNQHAPGVPRRAPKTTNHVLPQNLRTTCTCRTTQPHYMYAPTIVCRTFKTTLTLTSRTWQDLIGSLPRTVWTQERSGRQRVQSASSS